MSALCGARPHGFNEAVACQLPERHNSPHSAMDGELTWEPLYAGDLRREVEELRSALSDAVLLLKTPASEWTADDRDLAKWLETKAGA